MFPCTPSDNARSSPDMRLEIRVGRRTNDIFGGRDKEVPSEEWKGTLYYVNNTIRENAVKIVEQLLLEDGSTLRDTRTSGKQPLPSNYQP